MRFRLPLCGLLITLIFILFTSSAYALGVSPLVTTLEGVLVDTEVPRHLTISRATPVLAEQVRITISGSGAQYVDLPEGTLLDLPIGEQQTPFPFVVNTHGAPAGAYNVLFVVESIPQEVDAPGSPVLPAIAVSLNFSVTENELSDFSLSQVGIPSMDHCENFRFFYIADNHFSNTPRGVDRIVMDTGDREYSRQSSIPVTLPFIKEQIDIQTRWLFPPDVYENVFFRFYDQADSLLFTSTPKRFQISESESWCPVVGVRRFFSSLWHWFVELF